MNFYQNLGNNINRPLMQSGLLKATLLIDQFVDLNLAGIQSHQIESGILIHLLYSLFEKIKFKRSFLGQGEISENYESELLKRILKIRQSKSAFKNNSFDNFIAFISNSTKPEINTHLNKILPCAKNQNFTVEHPMIFGNLLSSDLSDIKKESISLAFLLPYKSPYIFSFNETEYFNNLLAYVIEKTSTNNNQTFLISFEYFDELQTEEKELLFRSFIRSIWISNLYNSNLDFSKLKLYIESNKDITIFNSSVNRLEELIKYQSIENKVTDWDEFLKKHPYSFSKKIKYTPTLSAQEGVEKISIKKDRKTISVEVSGIQGKVKTKSQKFKDVLAQIQIIVPMDTDILLLGETGTGKSEVARQIHLSRGLSEDKFIVLNCAAVPDTLIESELFGYKKGAHDKAYKDYDGKFKQADGGTLFLDEIGKASLDIQSKLLKVLETKTFSPLGSTRTEKTETKFIFAANENLSDLYQNNKLLRDLYFRISNASFTIPGLSERKEDIIEFINEFVQKYQFEFNHQITLRDEVIEYLIEQKWPGNIRQLNSVIFQILLFCKLHSIYEFEIDDIVNIRVDSHLEKTDSSFLGFEESFKNLFKDYYRRRNEFLNIPMYAKAGKEIATKESNYYSFLKLIVEPISANYYLSEKLKLTEASAIMGLDGRNGEASKINEKSLLYETIKAYFK